MSTLDDPILTIPLLCTAGVTFEEDCQSVSILAIFPDTSSFTHSLQCFLNICITKHLFSDGKSLLEAVGLLELVSHFDVDRIEFLELPESYLCAYLYSGFLSVLPTKR